MIAPKLYKVLKDGRSFHGGRHAWSLPKGKKPGKWHAVKEVYPCHFGFHLTTTPASWFADGCKVYECEHSEPVHCGDDKYAVRRVRLTRELDDSELMQHRILIAGEHEATDGQWWAFGSAKVKAFGSAKVKAFGSAKVKAFGSAKVKAFGSAKVEAFGSATVEAYESATVEAFGYATVEAYESATVKASGSATVEASGSATVEAYESATVKASGSATVKASGSATVIKWSRDCKVSLSDRAACVDRSAGKPVCTIAKGCAK